MRIALVNPNTNTATTEMMCRIAREEAPKGWDVEGITAPQGVPLLASPAHLAEAADVMAALCGRVAGYDGVIVAAFGDPGLPMLKIVLSSPVVGISEAAMKAAARHGRFAIVHTTKDMVDIIQKLAEGYGFGPNLAAIEEATGNVFALLGDTHMLVERLRAAVDTVVARDRVDAVIISGGVLADAARTLAPVAPVPLIQPVPAAVALLARYLAPPDQIVFPPLSA